jgi:general secretion pathway protein D
VKLQAKGKKGGAKAAYKVEIDELNNALILAAPAAVIREIKNIVGKLDISRPQVLIEAVIAQLSEDKPMSLVLICSIPVRIKGAILPILMGC